jgi:cytoskeletal protein CcmA (bactofilin family)
MFKTKSDNNMANEKISSSGTGTTLIGQGTKVKGDINSANDIRIDGTIVGNITSQAKIIIGATGFVEGDITGNQADIVGKVSGNLKIKDILMLRGDAVVDGNIFAAKLQIEPTSTFNGQCHMGANVVEMGGNEVQSAAK